MFRGTIRGHLLLVLLAVQSIPGLSGGTGPRAPQRPSSYLAWSLHQVLQKAFLENVLGTLCCAEGLHVLVPEHLELSLRAGVHGGDLGASAEPPAVARAREPSRLGVCSLCCKSRGFSGLQIGPGPERLENRGRWPWRPPSTPWRAGRAA